MALVGTSTKLIVSFLTESRSPTTGMLLMLYFNRKRMRVHFLFSPCIIVRRAAAIILTQKSALEVYVGLHSSKASAPVSDAVAVPTATFLHPKRFSKCSSTSKGLDQAQVGFFVLLVGLLGRILNCRNRSASAILVTRASLFNADNTANASRLASKDVQRLTNSRDA